MYPFAVYRNRDLRSRTLFPYVVEVQAELFTELQTCVVVPLSRAGPLTPFPLIYLTPTVSFERQAYVLMTPQLAGIARRELGTPVGSLADQGSAISGAVEFLLRGF